MTEDAPQEPPALDHDDDPNTQVGDFTTPDVDLTDLLGDDDPGETSSPGDAAADAALPVRGDGIPGEDGDQTETDTILADPETLDAITEAQGEQT